MDQGEKERLAEYKSDLRWLMSFLEGACFCPLILRGRLKHLYSIHWGLSYMGLFFVCEMPHSEQHQSRTYLKVLNFNSRLDLFPPEESILF